MTASSRTETREGGVDRSQPPMPGALRPFEFPLVEQRSLSDGVPVLVAEVRNHPVVTCSVLLGAGGILEDETRAGEASLTASLLESGAGSRDAVEIAEAIEALGAQTDTGVSWDVAHVTLTVLRSRTEAAFPLLADLVRRPTFPQAEVERLRAERLAQIAQRRADPRSLASELAMRFIFPSDSPFARPLGGTTRSVEQLTRQDVDAFHASHYGPGPAALLIVGDLGVDRALALVEEHFGGWAGARPENPPAPVTKPGEDARVVLVDRPGSAQAELRVGHIGVARDTADYFPLLVMNTVLGGAFSSRLNLNLRERHGFTYGVSSAFAMRRRPGPFLVSTAVQTEVTAPAVREIHDEIERIRATPITPSELDDARNYLAGVFPLRLQTTDGIASSLAELVVHGLAEDYWDTYRDNVLRVSAGQALHAAREHLRPEELVTLIVGDASQLRGPLEEAGFGPVQVVNPVDIAD